MGEVVQRVGRFFLHHPDVPFLGFSPHTRRSYLLLSFLRSARGNEILLCALCVLSVFSKRQKGHKGHKGERNNTICNSFANRYYLAEEEAERTSAVEDS